MASWVEERSLAPAVRVAAQAKLGRGLRHMPATAVAAATGELSAAHCRLLIVVSHRCDPRTVRAGRGTARGVREGDAVREFNQVIRG